MKPAAAGVPAETEVSFTTLGDGAEVLCCLPVGGRARMGNGALFTPPWAE